MTNNLDFTKSKTKNLYYTFNANVKSLSHHTQSVAVVRNNYNKRRSSMILELKVPTNCLCLKIALFCAQLFFAS